MFKKKCPGCGEKISKKFDFCPYCGAEAGEASNYEDKDKYGLLGKNDKIEEMENMLKPLKSPLFNKMIGSMIKMVEKEMFGYPEFRKVQRIPSNMPKANFELFINGKKILIPQQAQIGGKNKENRLGKTGEQMPKISEETLKNSIKLPRKEAKTKLTRISNKIIYELEAPGINKIENVIINKLEDSLEIKIYTEKTVYFKMLSVKLPLMQYSIKEGKLFLEFKAQ